MDSWIDQVEARVGREEVDAWLQSMDGSLTDIYDYSYSSFHRAMYFSVSFRSWPLRFELEWMLPRLRDAIVRSGSEDPFLVELGSGSGVAAALLSAALQVPIVAIDPHPATADTAQQFAQRVGGQVESQVAAAADLPEILDGRAPSGVFALSAFRYVMPHTHRDGGFSDWAAMRDILSNFRPPDGVTRVLDALQGSDLILSEVGCSDFAAEVAACMFPRGYRIPAGGITRAESPLPTGRTSTVLMQFTKADVQPAESNLLKEMYVPLPLPRPGLSIEHDETAEAMRWSLEPTEFISASEVDYTNGSGQLRTEFFQKDAMLGHYVTSSGGFRRIALYPISNVDAVAKAVIRDEAALVASGEATSKEIYSPATQWTTW